MRVHFEYPSGITQNDLVTYFDGKGARGKWIDWDLNLYEFNHETMEECFYISDLFDGNFKVNGVPVRGHVLPPPPPKLERGE